MPRDSKEIPRHEEQLGRPSASGSAPESADSGVGPGVDAFLSRSGVSHPLGKMTGELQRIRMHDETILVLQMKATRHGMTLSEYVRIVLECDAHGVDAVATMAADRIRRVGQLVGEKASQEAQT